MEKVLPESVPTRHLSGPLSPRVATAVRPGARRDWGLRSRIPGVATSTDALPKLTGLARAEHPARRCSTLSLPRLPSCSLFQQLRQGSPDAHLRWKWSVSPARPPRHAGK